MEKCKLLKVMKKLKLQITIE